MAYEKQTWTTGDVITQEKLNHMEDGIENAYELPAVTSEDDGKFLGVENGQFGLVNGGGMENLVDGSAAGSARGVNTAAEDSSYTMGWSAFAEGSGTRASGSASHAEGYTTTASDLASHAEGSNTTASGGQAHAEGCESTASGSQAHAEGYKTTASGNYAHAEGNGTTANCNSQHVFGEYNVGDTGSAGTRGTYIEIVGNGRSKTKPSNARTLDWNGNEALQGSLTLGKGSADETTVTAAQLRALITLLNQ